MQRVELVVQNEMIWPQRLEPTELGIVAATGQQVVAQLVPNEVNKELVGHLPRERLKSAIDAHTGLSRALVVRRHDQYAHELVIGFLVQSARGRHPESVPSSHAVAVGPWNEQLARGRRARATIHKAQSSNVREMSFRPPNLAGAPTWRPEGKEAQ